MKKGKVFGLKLFNVCLLSVLLGLLPPQISYAYHLRSDVSQLFYSRLVLYGNWVHHRIYGRVWYPSNVPEDWRPYQDGYWTYTAQYGWLWVSNWEWGWATDHYGRWAWDDWYGWIWVPGAVWAPAWVVWRYGGGFVSWAPLPVQYNWEPYTRGPLPVFDYDRFLPWYCWITTKFRDFPLRDRPRKFMSPDKAREIFKHTRFGEPLGLTQENIINRGIPRNEIERAAGLKIAVRDTFTGKVGDEKARSGKIPIVRPLPDLVGPERFLDESESANLAADKPEIVNSFGFTRGTLSKEQKAYRRPGRFSGKLAPIGAIESDQPKGEGTPDGALSKQRINQPLLPPNAQTRGESFSATRSLKPSTSDAQLQLLERQRLAEEARMRQEDVTNRGNAVAPVRGNRLTPRYSDWVRRQGDEEERLRMEDLHQLEQQQRRRLIDAERQERLREQRETERAHVQQEAILRQQVEAEQQRQSHEQQLRNGPGSFGGAEAPMGGAELRDRRSEFQQPQFTRQQPLNQPMENSVSPLHPPRTPSVVKPPESFPDAQPRGFRRNENGSGGQLRGFGVRRN